MLSVVAAVNNETIFNENLGKSQLLKNSELALYKQYDYRSAALAYNDGLKKCLSDIVIFAHQDVYFPKDWERQLMDNVRYLEQEDPNWAVLGLYGIKGNGMHVGQVWSSGLNKLLGATLERPEKVVSIDELVIILNVKSGIRFDDNMPGFHLYGTDIVQMALAVGKTCYVINAPVIHNSKSVLFLDKNYYRAYFFLQRKWRLILPIQNCILTIDNGSLAFWERRIKDFIKSIFSRLKRRSDFVTKSAVRKACDLGFE